VSKLIFEIQTETVRALKCEDWAATAAGDQKASVASNNPKCLETAIAVFTPRRYFPGDDPKNRFGSQTGAESVRRQTSATA
jgi:hypothetical protein